MEAQNSSESQEKVVVSDNNAKNDNDNDTNDNDDNSSQNQQPPPREAVKGGTVGGSGAQPWVPLQYPAGAPMVMQHPMMVPPPHFIPPPHYMAYHQQQMVYHKPHRVHHSGGTNGENKTIWVGDLFHWMEENYLRNCFASAGEVYSLYL